MNKTDILRLGLVAGTTGIGFVGGAFYARKRLEQIFTAQLEDQIEKIQEHYQKKHKDGPFATASSAAAVLITDTEGNTELVEVPDDIPHDLRPFARRQMELGNDPHEAVLEMMDKITPYTSDAVNSSPLTEEEVVTRLVSRTHRDPEKPYLIDVDEWGENDHGFEHLLMTWFSGDRVLMDERDVPVNEVEEMVGLRNLDAFGKTGSSDPNSIYIRNERMAVEFEIILDKNKYVDVMLGEQMLDEADEDLSNARKNPGRGRDN